MPSINMIAPRRAEKKRLLRDIRRLSIVITVEIVAIIAVSGWMGARVFGTRSRIDDLGVQLGKLQPTVQKIALYEKSIKELKPKVDLLGNARDCTMRWYNMLDKLSQSMPQSTWLTRLSTTSLPQQASTGVVTVNLNGISVSQQQVGEAMLRIHQNPDIDTVDLHFTQKTLVGTSDALEFELAAGLKVPQTEDDSKGGANGAVAKT